VVPRDIDPDINRLNNTYVYDIDDLKGVVEENIKDRSRESIKGERIVDEAVIRFQQWLESLGAVPTIVALRNKIDTIARTEIDKTLQSLNKLSDNDRRAIYRMTDSLINKILHDPTLFLKSNGCHGDRSAYIDLTRKLFKLDE
jgi:glutamyl-tRNA reductase